MDAENVATVVALVEETLVSDSDGIPGMLVNDAPEPLNVVAVQVPVTVKPPEVVSAFSVSYTHLRAHAT